jgi:hypothetical protein
MEPKPAYIQDLAVMDPIAAYGIVLGVPRIPISINAVASFSTFALDQIPTVAGLDTTIAQRTWIDNLQYSLSVPNAFAGSVFQTLWLANLIASPGVAVRCTVHSGPRYMVSPNFTPLENFVSLINRRWVAGWPLFKQQNLNIEFSLIAPPGGLSSSAAPYSVTLTLNGFQFLDHSIDEIAVSVASCKLRELGFWVPPAVECP